MIAVQGYQGRPVVVLGLGRAGLATAKALMAGGAIVRAWDDNEAARVRAFEQNVPLVNVNDATDGHWDGVDTLVISPGIPHTHPEPHPVAAIAKERGCRIIGEVELLARTQRRATYVGITGTNGKSTTTALIGHVLGLSGRRVEVGGNLGVPALELEPLEHGQVYVVEMSSYQLELVHNAHFAVSVMLNITPDHLSRHGGMEGYVAAKERIFHDQTPMDTAVIGTEDGESRAMLEKLRFRKGPKVRPVTVGRTEPEGISVIDGILYEDGTEAADLRGHPTLPGAHNWQNAAAAWAACRALGVPGETIAQAITSYPGLPHRQELVDVVDGIRWVNDSKATNPEAAAKALACYDAIYWIAGGRAKEGGLEALHPFLDKVRHAFLIGEAVGTFASGLAGRVDLTTPGDLEAAVAEARNMALAEGLRDAVVLLSPACASFDQFKSFEARGEAFRTLVQALPGRRNGGGR